MVSTSSKVAAAQAGELAKRAARTLPAGLRQSPPYRRLVEEARKAKSPTHRDYQRFVMLSHGRAGSNLFMTSLSQHPNIRCHFEIFNPRQAFTSGWSHTPVSAARKKIRDRNPQRFIDRFVFGAVPTHIQTVGCKIHPHQFTDLRFFAHARGLVDDSDTKLIRLSRRNKLAVLVSREHARETGVYLIDSESERHRIQSDSTIQLDPRYCEAEFYLLQAHDRYFDLIVSGRDPLVLEYSNFVANFDQRMREAQEFLGHDPIEVEKSIVQQRTRPLREVVGNYDELRRHFAGTEYESFFDEEDLGT